MTPMMFPIFISIAMLLFLSLSSADQAQCLIQNRFQMFLGNFMDHDDPDLSPWVQDDDFEIFEILNPGLTNLFRCFRYSDVITGYQPKPESVFNRIKSLGSTLFQKLRPVLTGWKLHPYTFRMETPDGIPGVPRRS